MTTQKKVIVVCGREISVSVVIPEEFENLVWKFMLEFGKRFTMGDAYRDITTIKPVNVYHKNPHSGDWYIEVSINEAEEEDFYKFLQSFCMENNFHFRSDIRSKS